MKRFTSLLLAALMLTSGSAFAASVTPAYTSTVTVTSTAGTVTPTAKSEVVEVRNDNAGTTVYVDFDATAVAAAHTVVPVGPCESVKVTFLGTRPTTISLITASATASVKVIATPGTVNTPTKAKPLSNAIVEYGSNPACESASGETTTIGSSFTKYAHSETLTLSTSGATTDTTANLLHANSQIDVVVCYQSTAITTATNWGISDPTTANRFAPATAIATTSLVGMDHLSPAAASAAAGPAQPAAAKLRITTTGSNPGAGAVTCTVFGRTAVVPTSPVS